MLSLRNEWNFRILGRVMSSDWKSYKQYIKSFSGALLILLPMLMSASTWAASFPARARLIVSTTQVKVPELNELLSSRGFDSVSLLPSVGVEITRPLGSRFEAGFRYQFRLLTRGVEGLDFGGGSPFAAFRQDTIQAIARLSVVRRKVFRADLVAGVGGNNSRFEIKNTAQDGELNRTALGDFVSTPMGSVGASFGFGAGKFYLMSEVGYERNRIPDLVKSGALTTSINTIDISGPYVMLSILFDGISASRR